MNKLVSVIIPTYKRPELLGRAIESVLGQTYQNIEIIIVDDNDSNSVERIKTEKVMFNYINNRKVIYEKHEKNKNGSAARNTGFRISKGEYIAFLDDDDEFLPEKISSQVACLENKDETWGACYTKYICKRCNKTIAVLKDKKEGNLFIEQLKRNVFISAGSNLMVRRKIYIEVNGFDESFKRNQDVEFLVKILYKHKLAYVDILGLIVNVKDNQKHSNLHNVDFDDITTHFIETFQFYISSLSEINKKEIFRMLNLQRFRAKLFDKKNIKEAIKMLKNKDVSLSDAIFYIIHLIKRYILKSKIGF